MDSQRDVTEIWRLSREKIMELEKPSKRSGIHVNTFRKVGELVWPSKEALQ